MSGWFLLASAIVQYQRKIKLSKKKIENLASKTVEMLFKSHQTKNDSPIFTIW